MDSSPRVRACNVCTYLTCGDWGGREVLEELRERLAGTEVWVREYKCFGGCPRGPNVILEPGYVWYGNVQPEDADDIAAHITGGPPVDRLRQEVREDELR